MKNQERTWEKYYAEWREAFSFATEIPNNFEVSRPYRAGFMHGVQHAQTQPVAPNGLTEEEQALLADNKLIACIKAVRDRTGLRLIDAKRFVDTVRGQQVRRP